MTVNDSKGKVAEHFLKTIKAPSHVGSRGQIQCRLITRSLKSDFWRLFWIRKDI